MCGSLFCGCFCGSVPHGRRKKSSSASGAGTTKRQDFISIMLLGTSDVGKSTIIQNLTINHGYFDENFQRQPNFFNHQYLEDSRPRVYRSLLSNFQILLKTAIHQNYEFSSVANRETAVQLANLTRRDIDSITSIDAGLKCNMQELWNDKAIKQVFQNRRNFRLTGNLREFMSDLNRISHPDYIPSVDDILLIRNSTENSSRHYLKIDSIKYCFTDVGGTPAERKKWPLFINRFCEDMAKIRASSKVIIFVASLADYNQVRHVREEDRKISTEDGKAPPFDDWHPVYDRRCTDLDVSISLFRLLIDSPPLKDKKFLLFLNMEDRFARRITEFKDFQDIYPDAPTQDNPELAKVYIQHQFEAEMRNSKFRNLDNLRTMFTKATDRRIMRAVFNLAKEQIFEDMVRRFAGGM